MPEKFLDLKTLTHTHFGKYQAGKRQDDTQGKMALTLPPLFLPPLLERDESDEDEGLFLPPERERELERERGEFRLR